MEGTSIVQSLFEGLLGPWRAGHEVVLSQKDDRRQRLVAVLQRGGALAYQTEPQGGCLVGVTYQPGAPATSAAAEHVAEIAAPGAGTSFTSPPGSSVTLWALLQPARSVVINGGVIAEDPAGCSSASGEGCLSWGRHAWVEFGASAMSTGGLAGELEACARVPLQPRCTGLSVSHRLTWQQRAGTVRRRTSLRAPLAGGRSLAAVHIFHDPPATAEALAFTLAPKGRAQGDGAWLPPARLPGPRAAWQPAVGDGGSGDDDCSRRGGQASSSRVPTARLALGSGGELGLCTWRQVWAHGVRSAVSYRGQQRQLAVEANHAAWRAVRAGVSVTADVSAPARTQGAAGCVCPTKAAARVGFGLRRHGQHRGWLWLDAACSRDKGLSGGLKLAARRRPWVQAPVDVGSMSVRVALQGPRRVDVRLWLRCAV